MTLAIVQWEMQSISASFNSPDDRAMYVDEIFVKGGVGQCYDALTNSFVYAGNTLERVWDGELLPADAGAPQLCAG